MRPKDFIAKIFLEIKKHTADRWTVKNCVIRPGELVE